MKEDDRNNAERPLVVLAKKLGLAPNFATLSPTQKLKTLLDHPKLDKIIKSMRADEFYILLKEIGLEDSYLLLLHATEEQKIALVDLEAWSGDSFLPERFEQVLELMLDLSRDEALNLIKKVEPELIAYEIFSQADVKLAREVQEDDTVGDYFLSPDMQFAIFCKDEKKVPVIKTLLDLMYEIDIEFAQMILFQGMADTPYSLEWQARYFREARLQDLGFPAPEERYAIYEEFDLKGLKESLQKSFSGQIPMTVFERPLALILAKQQGERLLFLKGLAEASEETDISAIVNEFLYVTNKIVAARTRDYFEEGVFEEASRHAVAVMSIGVEELCEGDLTRAKEIVLSVHPNYLYRSGLEVLRPLYWLALAIMKEVGGMKRLFVLGREREEVVRASLLFPPMFAMSLASPNMLKRRDFQNRAEVELQRRKLRETRALLKFAIRVFGFEPTGKAGTSRLITEPTLLNVFATAWARFVLSGEFSIEPLKGKDVQELVRIAFQGGMVKQDYRAIAERVINSAQSEEEELAVKAFVDEVFSALEENLGGLDPKKPVDTKFIGDALLLEA